ncbi:hypothetical protein BJP40_19890 [Streptomyces sp. CC53]|uniref:hypothetical protein n=1 Tax=Streptomyces sp. CC53 TaxID=1906740 RepID=UPI0008DD07CA|nr:hypothetical protein [Streptomyces sp. CC53]OII64602.1 hypothetical protein BJP40_19890 [Streptomyces sp. CC53]
MRTRTTTAAIALLLATLTGCSSSSEPEQPAAAPSQAPAAEAPSISAEDKAKAREAAGLPPKPDAATRQAFLDALNAIDPRIVDGKDEKAVSRGLNQCSSIKNSPDDKAKLAQLALGRFTVTSRLPEISTPETGAKINDVAHRHLCPDF